MDGRSINKNKTCTIITICKYTCVDTDRKEFAKKNGSRSIRMVREWAVAFFLKLVFMFLQYFYS